MVDFCDIIYLADCDKKGDTKEEMHMRDNYTLEDERRIGYNLSCVMEKKNISVLQLAEKCGCHEMRIKAILTGSVDVESNEIDAIANALNVNSADILREADEGMMQYNIHPMGRAKDAEGMKRVLDKVDMYVRLLNLSAE